MLIAQVFGQDEATEAILQTCAHTYALTRTTAIVKVLPHLCVCVCVCVHVCVCVCACVCVCVCVHVCV